MKKPNKKEMVYIGALLTATFILMWLLKRSAGDTQIVNGAGQTPDTGYLTYNLPAIGADGQPVPTFGDIYIPPLNYNGGGCNSCYSNDYYGTPQSLANAVGNAGADSVQQALQSLPGYAQLTIQNDVTSGSIYYADQQLVNSLPVLALGPINQSNITQPVQKTGKVTNLPILAY